ncbi:hypothetical protein R3P38DRAFT_3236851 [Favolaschia claudopus]|uniref:Proteophosphoglycan ppg4 n=1 Tax=Favolaschia claudopus TaxID=2862362 RepID=A0AAV9ZC43_9AGAR
MMLSSPLVPLPAPASPRSSTYSLALSHTPTPPPSPFLPYRNFQRMRSLTFGPGSAHPAPAYAGESSAGGINGSGNGSANGHVYTNGRPPQSPPPPKSPARSQSRGEKDGEKGKDTDAQSVAKNVQDTNVSRSRERLPFPNDGVFALPTLSSAPGLTSAAPSQAPTSHIHASSLPPSSSATGVQSSAGPSGSAHGHSSGLAPGAKASSADATVARSISLPLPRPSPSSSSTIMPAIQSNAHIPLAIQTRAREMSDPLASQPQSLLANAATRAPGSPPIHVQSHSPPAQYGGQSAYRPSPRTVSQPSSSSHPRTPEQTASTSSSPPSHQTPPERRPSQSGSSRGAYLVRDGSLRAVSEGAHLMREGSLRASELALDVKRLLAKPASLSSSSRARAESSGGESSGTEGTHLRKKRYDAFGNRVDHVEGRRSEDGAAVRQKEKEEKSVHREQEKRDRAAALSFIAPHSGTDEKEKKEKRQKNVLRRKPSASRPAPRVSSPTPAAVTPIVVARTAPPMLNLDLSLDPIPTFGGLPSPRGSPGSGSGSGNLTPAGAVAQAYKRGLDNNSPYSSPLPSPASGSFSRHASDSGHGDLVTTLTQQPSSPITPYYTVFGSTSGRVVAVGGPDDSFDGGGSFISATAYSGLEGGSRPRSMKKDSSSSSVGRTLTRKVSERWVRKREGSEDEARGRTASQSDRVKKSTRSGSRATGDDHSPTREFDPAPLVKSPLASYDHGGELLANEPRSRRSEPAMGGGSKIWKLMKRISTGGLKEKYDRGNPRSLPPIPPLPPVPPVPQLPKDVSLEARSAMSSDGHSREDTSAISRFMQSRASISGSHPTSIPRPSARALPMPPPIPGAQPSRVSTTTRSSSPVSSSDVASSKFFHKTTSSARSSTSSLADDTAPPVPGIPSNSIIGKHIVPPKDLYKLDLEFQSGSLDEKKPSLKPLAFFGAQPNTLRPIDRDDWAIVRTPADELPPSLPHPPRRLPMPNSSLSERKANRRMSDTPSIPEFSTVAPVNAFASRRPSRGTADKSSTRAVTSVLSSLEPSPPHRQSVLRDQSTSHPLPRTSSVSVPSSSSHSTARQKRQQQRSASLPRSEPLTFRDMSEKTSQALTEKEKADRWDDLLQRSDRAGGTLHLGASEQLQSDELSLRYSTSSTQLLNDF